jgi:PAS domain S-box-containing protein
MTNADDEPARLRTLHAYGVLDTPREPAFDRLAEAAAKTCGAGMAAVSLVDADRQWFKAEVGLGVRETPRSVSFCTHAMHRREVFVVADTELDPRFRDNPLVTGGPRLRFYAGAAIRSADGAPLGALCVLDTRPRPGGLDSFQTEMLQVLAEQVEAQLRLRQQLGERDRLVEREAALALASREREARLLVALESAQVGWWDWDVAADRMYANADMARGAGVDVAAAAEGSPLAVFMARIHPQDQPALHDAIADAMRTGELFREEYRVLASDDRVRWTSARGRCLLDASGAAVRFAGVALDITDRKLAEERLREADIGRELAMDAARLGRFDHDLVTGRRFYNERALEMFDLTLDQMQDTELVLSRLHPDDREGVVSAQLAARNPERRGLYRQVYRVRHPRTGEERWISGVGRTRFENGACTRFMGVLEDVTEAKQAEAHRQLLNNELNHRVKNTLALVQGLVDASLRSTPDPLAARQDIAGRIQALGRAHDLLTAQSWSAAQVQDVAAEVASGLSLPAERWRASGPPVQLGPKPALQLALALHELATNALKYGALSNALGWVELTWGLHLTAGVEHVTVQWLERGGPPVSPPARRGFGSRLIERATAVEFAGAVELSYAPEGVRWVLDAPYLGLAERGRAPADLPGSAPGQRGTTAASIG